MHRSQAAINVGSLAIWPGIVKLDCRKLACRKE